MGLGKLVTTSLNAAQRITETPGPLEGEELVEYSIFLSDQFGKNPSTLGNRSSIQFMDSNSIPNQFEGFQNDDSYRQSRHFVRRSKVSSLTSNDRSLGLASHLRENSLARQLQEKADQPGIIRLLKRIRPGDVDARTAGEGQPWVNIIPPNTKFFLETVQENREEKVQVLDTFGEFVAFFFGARPEVYSYSGVLLNSLNHNWKNEFQQNYEYFLRGTQAVKNRATMFLQYDDVIVEGYMLNSQVRQSALNEKSVPFSFNLLVLSRSSMSPRNILTARLRRSELTSFELQVLGSLQAALTLTKGQNTSDVQTFLLMREWLSESRFPASGVGTHFPETNKIEPERTGNPIDQALDDSKTINEPFRPNTYRLEPAR